MSKPKIRVCIVDDHPLIRNGLSVMIDAEDDLEMVGEAGSGEEALRVLPALAPDVVLMDQVMGGIGGIEATEVLKKQLPDTKFVILTSLVEPALVRQAIVSGVRGFLLKTASAHELVAAIRSIHAGRTVLDAEATDSLFDTRGVSSPGDDLTARERELLALMARGYNNQEIASELQIGLPTVKFHVSNIFSKLEVDNRIDAVLVALKHKLVPPV